MILTKSIRAVISHWNGYPCSCCSDTYDTTEVEIVPQDMSKGDILKMLRDKYEYENDDGSKGVISEVIEIGKRLL